MMSFVSVGGGILCRGEESDSLGWVDWGWGRGCVCLSLTRLEVRWVNWVGDCGGDVLGGAVSWGSGAWWVLHAIDG